MQQRNRGTRSRCAERERSCNNVLKGWWLAWILAVLATMLATSLSAQDARGLFGMIVDDVGRPIAGVDITLRDESGTTNTTTTDANGQYRIPNVPTDMFSVAVRQAGFVPDARLLREAPAGSFDFALLPVEDSTVQRDVDANWRRDLELFDRAMLVADPINVLTRADLEEGKFSFTGDLLNLLPGVPKAPLRTAARCTQFLLNDFPERSSIGDAGASIANIPTDQLKIVMVRTPGNPMPEVWLPFAYNSGCTVVAAYTM